MDSVRIQDSFCDVVVVDSLRASAAERGAALPGTRAAFLLRTRCAGRLDARTLARLYALAYDHSIGAACAGPSRELLLRRIEDAAACGRLLLVERARRAVVLTSEVSGGVDDALGPAPERQDVDFVFEYDDGTPVRGLRYVLADPGGAQQKGELGADGEVGRKDVSGTWACSLVEIDLVEWARRRARAGESVDVAVRCSGLDDGAKATVRVYRLHDEDPGRAVVELSAEVQQGRATASWTCALSPHDASSGVASFVAEASAEGGKVWRKSEPLDVEIAAIARAAWSRPTVAPGEDVDLVVEAPGFADGAEVAVTLVRHRPAGEDETVATLDPPPALQRRTARATLRCGGVLPARAGDVYARVTVRGGGVERTACTPVLWVDATRAAGEPEAA